MRIVSYDNSYAPSSRCTFHSSFGLYPGGYRSSQSSIAICERIVNLQNHHGTHILPHMPFFHKSYSSHRPRLTSIDRTFLPSRIDRDPLKDSRFLRVISLYDPFNFDFTFDLTILSKKSDIKAILCSIQIENNKFSFMNEPKHKPQQQRTGGIRTGS